MPKKTIIRLTPKQSVLAAWKDRALRDPLFFNRRVLGRDKLVGRIHGEQLRALQVHDKCLFLEPREHFKTTNVTEGYLLWRFCKNPDLRALVVHKPYREARGYVSVIRQHFEETPMLRELFGDFTSRQRWSDDQLMFNRRKRTVVTKDPSLAAASPEHDPVGGHYHIIVCDDIVGLKDRYSRAERIKTERYLRALWAMLLPGGQFIMIGTRWHQADAYTLILGRPGDKIPQREDFHYRIRRAISPEGEVYFPEQFDKDRLDTLRLGMADALFEAQMLNNPVPEGTKRFDVDRFHLYNPGPLPPEGRRFAFIDPATGEDLDKGDDTVLIIGVRSQKKVKIDYASLRNEPFEQFAPKLVDAVKKYRPPVLHVEANAFQTFFAKECRRALADAGIRNVRIAKVKQSRSKMERIDSIEPMLMNGEVLFRADWDTAYPRLISQLGDFPAAEHDDGPDALEGLLAAALGRGVRRKVTITGVTIR